MSIFQQVWRDLRLREFHAIRCVLIIQVRWIVKISWMVFDLKLRKLFFFSLSFGFHSQLELMAKLQGPALCFPDLGPVVLIRRVTEKSECVNLSESYIIS